MRLRNVQSEPVTNRMPGEPPHPPGRASLLLQQQLLGSSDEVKVFKDEGEQDQQELSASESLQAELLGEKTGGWLLESEQLTGKQLGPPPPGFPWTVAHFPPPGAPHLAPLYPLRAPTNTLYNQQALSLQAAYSHQLAAWHHGAPPPYYLPLHPGAPPPPMPGLVPPPHNPYNFPGFGGPDRMAEGPTRHTSPRKKEPHIKKPLNAFMLFMKEMRPVVQAECTLKESAAINQVLGRRWHNLSRGEQAEYYERARQERALHMERYPDWNARDNYRHSADSRQKKKKRKMEKMADPAAGMKKCRARYGVDQPDLWCQPCKRKKKCVRVQMYLASQEGGQETEEAPDDPLSGGPSSGSDGEAGSPGSGFSETSGSPGPPEWAGSPLSPLLPFPTPTSRPGKVGSDPRDSNNPLSVSSLTNTCRMPPSPVLTHEL